MTRSSFFYAANLQQDQKLHILACTAAKQNNLRRLKKLCLKGANLLYRDETGKTALDYAQSHQNHDMILFIKEKTGVTFLQNIQLR